MALEQMTTPTVRPPSSLDLLDEDPQSASNSVHDTLDGFTTNRPNSGTGLQPPSGLAPPPNLGGVNAFAENAMANPSRWDAGIIRQGVDLINQDLEEDKKRGVADMDEYYSSRGLVGSNVEDQGRRDFLTQLGRRKDQMTFDLVREMANTYANDRASAGDLGLRTGGLGLSQWGMGLDDAYRRQAGDQQAQLSAADIYLRALAAGAGDYADFGMPEFNNLWNWPGGGAGGNLPDDLADDRPQWPGNNDPTGGGFDERPEWPGGGGSGWDVLDDFMSGRPGANLPPPPQLTPWWANYASYR